jgi:multicomponent Na+:H+ antiporter subunit C
MESLLAIVIGVLYAAGIYMMLRRSLFKVILGLVLISHGANLLIFTAAGLNVSSEGIRPHPPIVPLEAATFDQPTADPLPQALILTAIVISFGVLAFALALFHRTHQTIGSEDSDDLRVGEA